MIKEDEELFVRLSLMHVVDSPQRNELIREGYITESHISTIKAEEFKEAFIAIYKEQIFQAMKKSNNDNHLARKEVGLRSWVAFAVIADKLVYEKRFIRDEHERYQVNRKLNTHP